MVPELFKQKGYTTAVIGKFFHKTEYAEKQLMAFDRIESYQPPPDWKGPGPIMNFPLPERTGTAAKSNITVDPQEVEKRKQGEKKRKKGEQDPVLKKMNSDRYGDSGFKLEDEGDWRNAQIASALLKEFAKEKKPFFLHVHYLTGLEPGATYHYRLVTTDERGRTVTSADRTLTPRPRAPNVARSRAYQQCDLPFRKSAPERSMLPRVRRVYSRR